MRDSSSPATIGELMGKAGSKSDLGLKDLPEILGEKMPELPKNRLGKMRLLNALQIRFGQGYKNIPMVSGIIKEFDKEVELENVLRANKRKS